MTAPLRLSLAFLCAAALAAGSGCSSSSRSAQARFYAGQGQNLSPTGFRYDLTTPEGFYVQTNGQYPTDAQRAAAGAAIDRYWRAVKACVLQSLPAQDDPVANKLLPQFSDHLTITIAAHWRIVERRHINMQQQAFPSPDISGAWVSASGARDKLAIKVVPELNGLGSAMAVQVNRWLSSQDPDLPGDLAGLCAAVPCFRFDYDNSPSQAWDYCSD